MTDKWNARLAQHEQLQKRIRAAHEAYKQKYAEQEAELQELKRHHSAALVDGQFTHAMNRAGWRSIGQGCYVHQQTKHKFYALTFEPRIQDVAWKEWAKVERTPAPFDE
jgi:hypothetical protein